MPVLTPNEWCVVTYLMRRTYARRVRAARISIRQFSRGVWTEMHGHFRDAGTGIAEPSVRRAVQTLQRFGVIIRLKPEIADKQLGPLYRLGWTDEINWDGLWERHLDQQARLAANLGAESWIKSGVRQPIKTVDKTVSAGIYEELVLLNGDNVNMEGSNESKMYLPGLPDLRRDTRPPVVAYGEKLGMEAKDVTAFVDAVLAIRGLGLLADQDTQFGNRALNEAQEAAQTLLGFGYRTPAHIDQLLELWKDGWQYKQGLAKGRSGKDLMPYYTQLVNFAVNKVDAVVGDPLRQRRDEVRNYTRNPEPENFPSIGALDLGFSLEE